MNPLGAALSEGVRFCASKETSDRFPFATFIICFCAEKSIHTQKVHNCVKFIIVLLQSASSSPLTGQPPDMRCRALQFSRNAATKKRSRRGRTAKLHLKINQRLENWGARRAAFRPYSPDLDPKRPVFMRFFGLSSLSKPIGKPTKSRNFWCSLTQPECSIHNAA